MIYDDDPYFMGGILAEMLAKAGREVVLVTTGPEVSPWTHNTLEHTRIQTRLMELGVAFRINQTVQSRTPNRIDTACAYTGRVETIEAHTLVLVTSRSPVRTLADALTAQEARWSGAGVTSVTVIGDALAPATIAAAVYAGHRFGREIDAEPGDSRFHFERESIEA